MATQRELELQLVQEAQKRGLTPEQTKEAVLKYRTQLGVEPRSTGAVAPSATGSPNTKSPGFKENVAESLRNRWGAVEQAADLYGGNEQTLAESSLQTVGAGAGLLGDVVVSGLGAITPAAIKDPLKQAVSSVMQTKPAQQIVQGVQQFATEHPRAARNIGAGLNIASVVPAVRGAGIGAKAGARTAGLGANAVGNVVKPVVRAASKAATGAVVPAIKSTARFASSIPKRLEVASDVAKVASAERAASSLAAKEASKMGVKLRHANLIEKAAPQERKVFRDMFNQAKMYEVDRSANSPAEIGGKQLQQRIQSADELRGAIGQELGDAVKGLAGQDAPARLAALKRLQEVPGLKNLKIKNDGSLDFSRTGLSSNLTKTDRSAIEDAFSAIKGKDAEGHHLLRQEIFEVTGGKKRAQVPLTDTQDKALEAIRQGLADVLEKVSPRYRELNKRYALIAEPLKNLRKSFSGFEGASGDILDEASGKLLRRLTNESMGGSKLKLAISKIDDVLAAEGKPSSVSLQKIQDFMNVLDDSFDIVKDTSFAGQTGLGVGGGVRGAADFLVGKVSEAISSKSVRQKALEDLLMVE